jgi:sulfide:quinone oxidoreductase
MQPRQLTEQLSVAPQIVAADMPAIVAQGFRSVGINGADDEARGEQGNAALEAAAHAAGLEWRHIPVVSGKVNDDQVRSFSEALAQLPGPVLAFCRSGTRCSALWALSSDDTVDNILATTEAAGYDLSILRGWLEMSRR